MHREKSTMDTVVSTCKRLLLKIVIWKLVPKSNYDLMNFFIRFSKYYREVFRTLPTIYGEVFCKNR